MDAIKSVLIWLAVAVLIILWLPMLALCRLCDPDPAHYYTGLLFRKLGKAISKINPYWNITISGHVGINDRNPYVIVCNHLSQADIPLISNLPWEMKWVAKKELFDTPVVGWMMKLAGDISVNRRALLRKKATLETAGAYLSQKCSVIFFPEGTRSRNGKLNAFTTGAFELAVREQIPILPMVIDGTQTCLPKRSWKFGTAQNIRLKVMEPVPTEGLSERDVSELVSKVRDSMLKQLSQWRGQAPEQVDNAIKQKS